MRTSSFAALLPWVLIASALAAEDGTVRKDRRPGAQYLPPEACKRCHPRHYEEWRGSMHAYSVTDPVFFAMNALGQRQTGGELGDFCIRCHGPIGTLSGEIVPDVGGPDGLSPIARAGVSCQVCHLAVRLQPAHPANANFELQPGGPMLGGLADPLPNAFHDSRRSDLIASPEFCGSCHNVVNRRGVKVEKPYDEYAESEFASRGIGCVDCHMQVYTGRATPDGPIRRNLHRHDFVGVDVALTPFPRRGFQRQEVESFLRTAAVMTVEAPRRVQRGGSFDITASVKNAGAGHNLPTGPSTERQMWLEVTVKTDSGAPVFRSGHLDSHGELAAERGPLGADPQLTLFTDRFLDADGEEVPFMWQAYRLEERTIPPLATRRATYQVTLAEDLRAASLHISVRLLFRAFPPHQLERLGLGDLRDRFPIFVMREYESGPIEVLELPADVIRVPEDAATIQAAMEGARSGVEIVVGPGQYRLEQPIDFLGRDVILRSRDGPVATVLEGAASPSDPNAASLVRFVRGESPAARLEGFTLTGGRGSVLAGVRAGGAAICLESHPTITGNVFTDNRAKGGDGGAVYLRNSLAHLRSNVFEDNRAGRRGGAVCSTGDSRVLVEANRLLRNRAPEGGAIALGPGDILLGNEILRNRAFRGGGLFVAAAGGSVALVKENLLAANSARDGGAVLVEGPGEALLERNILAGNLGGALLAEGRARVRAPHTTLVDNRAGPPVVLRGDSRVRFTNSILWGNRPPRISGEVAHSLSDSPLSPGNSNALLEGAVPVFEPLAARWERCRGPEEGCMPVIRDDMHPSEPRLWRRYHPGTYQPLAGSPTVDGGDPGASPDPDGSLPDLGARRAPRARNLFIRGDLNGDFRVDLADAERLVEALRGSPPACPNAADVDDSGELDPADLCRLLDYLLHRAAPPPAPFPACGVDPSPRDGLGCFEARCTPR